MWLCLIVCNSAGTFWKPEEDIRCPGAGAMGDYGLLDDCEQTHMSPRGPTPVLCKSSKCCQLWNHLSSWLLVYKETSFITTFSCQYSLLTVKDVNSITFTNTSLFWSSSSKSWQLYAILPNLRNNAFDKVLFLISTE